MYNPKFTPEPFDGNVTVSRGQKLINDAKGLALGTLSGKAIFNLTGDKIADFEGTEFVIDAEGNKKKRSNYTSEAYGKLWLADGVLYGDDTTPIGYVPIRERNITSIIALALASLFLLATIIFIWMIDLPYAEVPVIDIKDDSGSWTAQGTIAVFDETISPGTSGEYVFVLNNPHNVDLNYYFKIKEMYNDEEVTNFPLEFRLRMNNVLMETERWLSAEELLYEDLVILADTDHRFTLEWRWKYESGDDALDTYFGVDGGVYTLVFDLTAESN